MLNLDAFLSVGMLNSETLVSVRFLRRNLTKYDEISSELVDGHLEGTILRKLVFPLQNLIQAQILHKIDFWARLKRFFALSDAEMVINFSREFFLF